MEAMPAPQPVPMLARSARCAKSRGQATVEFAVASFFFLFIVFATIDFGRVVYTYSQLHNAVREGARVGKVNCASPSAIKAAVLDKAPAGTLTPVVTIPSGCNPPTGTVKVAAQTTFTAVTQSFLGISPITLNASAKVDVE